MKPKIVNINNADNYSFIVFLKEQSLLKVLSKILLKLDVDKEYVAAMISKKALCEVEEIIDRGDKVVEVGINRLIDERFNFSDEGFNIDIIFGKNKVFLIAYMNSINRDKMMNIIKNECDFVKYINSSQKNSRWEKLEKLSKKQPYKLLDLMNIGFDRNEVKDKDELILLLSTEPESKIIKALKKLK